MARPLRGRSGKVKEWKSRKVSASNLLFHFFHFSTSSTFLRLFQRQHFLRRRLLDESRGRIEAERLCHVLDLREVGQIVQPEADQELLGRRIQKWAADDVLPADDFDQV